MYEAGELKKGLSIQIDGTPYVITSVEFVKPGKGQAVYRCRLRNLLDGSVIDRTFRSGDKFEPANTYQREMQFMYSEGDQYYFMDTKTFEQIFVNAELIGDARKFMLPETVCTVTFFGEKPISVQLPNFVELKVISAGSSFVGDTVSSTYKTVTVETGATIQVPPFIKEGDRIKIDTRSGTGVYVERV
ncbi:MAG: elongation factor P [Dehalococcoidia bacterium]|nr:elongation factor P [Dehalococcoidia bacterium]